MHFSIKVRKRKKEKKMDKTGFTLIEILVVIAILGILAVIAIPQYSKYVNQAAASNAQAVLTSCLHEAMANFLANKTNDATNCSVGASTVLISLDTHGNLNAIAPTNVLVKGKSITCTPHLGSNTISCTP